MRIISTLTYQKDLAKLTHITNDDVVHVYDIFNQAEVDVILLKGTPKYIISDHITSSNINFNNIKFYGLPLYANYISKKIIKNIKFDNNINTLNCFNFIINKKQVNRFLCIKLVEWFKLSDFDYTWSAVDQNFDMSKIINELDFLGEKSPLDTDARAFILSKIQLTQKFIKFSDEAIDNSAVHNYGSADWVWQNIMQKLFLSSAVSLITESVAYEPSSAFTEKTIYSVLGLTFPIWVGGYNQAIEWKRLGFDIFDDIIDHSYQSYNTLIERCYYAFANNLDLLQKKEKTKKLRLMVKDRLIKNRTLLLQNQLEKFIDSEINNFPKDLQLVMPEILNYFK